MHYVYILYSKFADRFYIGESANVELRLDYHRRGEERYTGRASDWELVFKKVVPDRERARSIEHNIKSSKSRKSILRWIKGPDNMVSTP